MTRARRVLIVGPLPPPFHGVATFLRDLLGAAAHFPEFHFDHLDTSDPRDASNLGRWDAGNLCLGFSNLAELTSRLARGHHDLVYIPISQNIPAFLRDALFIAHARLFGARVVLHLHGGFFREFYDTQAPGWFRSIARLALKHARAVIVLSTEFRGIFDGLVSSDRIHIVENGVPGPWSSSPPLSMGRTILYMSTLARTKGILDLIRAVRILRGDFADVRLRIAGGWSESDTRAEALRFIELEKLGDHIEFTGVVDGAAKFHFLASGNLFCLPTRYPYEGQPLAVLEAMSAGLPVLATRHGALSSTVEDGVTGQLLPRDCTPEQIATALRAMFADPAKLRAQGAAGRQRFLDRFTLEKCHARLAVVFIEAATERPGSPR